MDELGVGLDPRLIGGSITMNPFIASCSSSRSTMCSSFMSQMQVLSGSTPRVVSTGAEREYGKYTMRIEIPCRCKVLNIIKKYPKYLGTHTFKANGETTIIYENLDNGELGCVRIPTYHCNHKALGFEYKINPIVKNLTPGTLLEAGTVLADSPSVKETGDYHYGIQTNVAFMSVPGIIEDGVVASKSYLERMVSRGYAQKTMEWGLDEYPLNLYGDDEVYKPFPEIGERVRDDGVIFATRKYDPILAICNMSVEALKTINHTFDEVIYISPSSVSADDMPVVENISIWHTHNTDLHRTPTSMEAQLRKYHDATKIYHTSIYDTYLREQTRRKGNVVTSNPFHATLVRCCVNDNNIPKMQLPKSITRTFRRNKLQDWRISIELGWNIRPSLGSKVSDCYG